MPKKVLSEAQLNQRRNALVNARAAKVLKKSNIDRSQVANNSIDLMIKPNVVVNRVIAYLSENPKVEENPYFINDPISNNTFKYIKLTDDIKYIPTETDFSIYLPPFSGYDFAIMVTFETDSTNPPNENNLNKIIKGNKFESSRFYSSIERAVEIMTPMKYTDKFDVILGNLYTPERGAKLMKILLRQYVDYTREFYIQFFKQNSSPRPFELFDAIDSNCVIDIIQNYFDLKLKIAKIPKIKEIEKNITILKGIKQDILDENKGFLLKHAELVYSKLSLKLRIHHNGGIWYEKISKKHCPIIPIFAHDNHATAFVPITKIKNAVYIEETSVIVKDGLKVDTHKPTAVFGSVVSIMETTLSTGVLSKINLKIKGYHQGDTVYKSFRPPSPDDTNSEYYPCMTNLSYLSKKWKLDNNIRPPSEPYFSMIKSASHFISSLQFEEIDNYSHYHADINKAYPSFKTNKYYEQFKLPLGYYNFGIVDDIAINIVSKTGWSVIDNVNFIHPLLEKMNYIQNGAIYTNLRLFHILTNNLATFTITSTITSVGEDIAMPFLTEVTNKSDKRFNNSFVGNLIARNKTTDCYYQSSNKSELEQINYDASKEADYLSCHYYNNETLSITKKNKSKKQLYNIHTYIIDYAQTLLIQKMCENYHCGIIAYNTDGFFTHIMTDIPHSEVHGEFKQEYKQINFISTFDAKVHTAPVLPEFIPTISNKANNSLTIGAPGTGKSKQIFLNPFQSSNLCCPTHKLKNTHKPNMLKSPIVRKIMTYHKYFQVVKCSYDRKVEILENIYIDECTMINSDVLNHISEFAEKYRINLHFVGDIDENGIHQLPPVSITGFEKEIEFDYFLNNPKL